MCVGLPPTVGPVPIHVGPDPLPAEDGWVCTFYPRGDESFPEAIARKLYQAVRLWRRVP